MKITLDIDPQVLGTEVSEFIKTLTPEDKNALVKQVVGEYYQDYRKFEDGEKKKFEAEALVRTRVNMSDYMRAQYPTDESLKTSYQFADEMKKHKTYAQSTREEISGAIRAALHDNIKKFIAEDETYKALLASSMQVVKEAFPLMVQNAMIEHMRQQLPDMMGQVRDMGNIFDTRIREIEQRLLR